MTATALLPFREPAFRALWLANLVSNVGTMIQGVGAAWLMTTLSDSAAMVALVQGSSTLPFVILALFAGAMADNYSRRHVMIVAQMLMFVSSVILAIETIAGMITPAGLLAFTFLIGAGNALNGPSYQASLRDQVRMEVLPAAVALNSIGFNLARSVGPGIGGLLMATFGPAANFIVNAGSYVGITAVLLNWKPTVAAPVREPLLKVVSTALGHAFRTGEVRRAIARAGLFGFTTAALWALMPLVARDLLGGNQTDFGLLLGAIGAGAIAGAFCASNARGRFRNEHVLTLAIFAFAAGTAGAGLSSSLFLTMALVTLAGAGWVMGLSTINIVIQIFAPARSLGRCIAIYQMALFGGQTLGSYCWGSLADHKGVAGALVASGLLLLVSVAAGLIAALPETHAPPPIAPV